MIILSLEVVFSTTSLDIRPAISPPSSLDVYLRSPFLLVIYFLDQKLTMLGYESSMVTTRTDSDCITLPIHMSPTSFPEKEFLLANPNHSITRSWQKNNIGDSIIALLERHNFQFYAVDCLRRPRLLAYLKHILRDNPVFENDSHTVVITLRAMPENHAVLTEVMEVIHWELVGEYPLIFAES